MNIWIQNIDGKSHLCLNFTLEEKPLLHKYHKDITRLTNLEFRSCLNRNERKEDEQWYGFSK